LVTPAFCIVIESRHTEWEGLVRSLTVYLSQRQFIFESKTLPVLPIEEGRKEEDKILPPGDAGTAGDSKFIRSLRKRGRKDFEISKKSNRRHLDITTGKTKFFDLDMEGFPLVAEETF